LPGLICRICVYDPGKDSVEPQPVTGDIPRYDGFDFMHEVRSLIRKGAVIGRRSDHRLARKEFGMGLCEC